MLIRNWADQAAASDPKGKKASRPPKAAVAAPPEYVAWIYLHVFQPVVLL